MVYQGYLRYCCQNFFDLCRLLQDVNFFSFMKKIFLNIIFNTFQNNNSQYFWAEESKFLKVTAMLSHLNWKKTWFLIDNCTVELIWNIIIYNFDSCLTSAFFLSVYLQSKKEFCRIQETWLIRSFVALELRIWSCVFAFLMAFNIQLHIHQFSLEVYFNWPRVIDWLTEFQGSFVVWQPCRGCLENCNNQHWNIQVSLISNLKQLNCKT